MMNSTFSEFIKGDFMGKFRKSVWLFILVIDVVVIMPKLSVAAFYKYVDRDGKIYFVDDIYKIPEVYRQQTKVYHEKYDHLSDAEKSQALESERARIEAQALKLQRQTNIRLQEIKELESEEQRKKTEAAREKLLQKAQTHVIIDGNQLLVPVTLVNGGVETKTHLLLDTGASQIVLFRSFAQQLNIASLNKGHAQVAGGQIIQVETGRIGRFVVGPHEMQDARVIILEHEGQSLKYSGLLGMNFLKNVQYTIDYRNQVIHWESGEEVQATSK